MRPNESQEYLKLAANPAGEYLKLNLFWLRAFRVLKLNSLSFRIQSLLKTGET